MSIKQYGGNFIKSVLTIVMVIAIQFGLPACTNKPVSDSSDDYKKDLFDEEIVIEDEFGLSIKHTDNFVSVAETNKYAMSLNGFTNQVRITDKNSGKEWDNFPLNNPGDNNGAIKVEYVSNSGSRSIYNSNSDSIPYGQYYYAKIPGGIRCSYILGEIKKRRLVPLAITKERMDTRILNYLNEMDQTLMKTYYTLISLSHIENDLDRAVLEERFPLLKSHDLYILGKSAAESDSISDIVLEMVESIIKTTPYTFEDLEHDHSENSISLKTQEDLSIQISIDYYLEGEELVVNIPGNGLKYNEKIIYITDLAVLPFFGAGDKNTDGYSLIPDGSGALINFNNNKTDFDVYKKPVYGRDRAEVLEKSIKEEFTDIHLPVFGIMSGDKGLFAVIEEGDAISFINSSVAGKPSDYNQTYSSFKLSTVVPMDYIVVGSSANSFQREPYSGDIKIRYFLLNDNPDYVDMAIVYRDYLEAKKNTELSGEKLHPLGIEFLGGITIVESTLGLPLKRIFPLTSYDDAVNILEILKKEGVKESHVEYLYWGNNGKENTSAFDIKTIKRLGGKRKFERLSAYNLDNGNSFYPAVEFSYVRKDKLVDKFNSKKMGSRQTTDELAYAYEYDIATLERINKGRFYIVSAKSFQDMFKSFFDAYKKYNLNTLSVCSVGTDINSDFKQNNTYNREMVKNIIKEEMNKINNSGYKLSFKGGNSYIIPYATSLSEIPGFSSRNYLFDEEIPFMQIALRGLLSLYSTPINLSDNYPMDLLRNIETGVPPFFKLMYEENSELKETTYNFYGLHYKDWLTEIIELYQIFYEEFNLIKDSKIVGHRKLAEKVYETSYQNGVRVYVNYSENVFKQEDVTVNPMSFYIKENVR